jgi:predicted RNase H-like nuclease (RuvC/YqgF family)
MLQNAPEFNSVGGGFGGFGGLGGGGFGAFGLIGLLGLDSLGNRRKDDCNGPGVNELATLQAISNAKDTTVAEGRALGAAICESEKTTLNQFYASAIQAANNTQSIKDQATGFAIVNDKRFDDVTTQIANTTAAILSRINDVENQNLRDQLFETRRRVDAKETELHITNTNINTNAQAQAQAQIQTQRDFDLHRRLDGVFNSFNQLNRTANETYNWGTMAASGNQATQATNIK